MKRYLPLIVLLGFVACQTRTANLEVKSVPTGIEVELDGEPTQQTTDCRLENLYAGYHLVTLTKGNISWQDTADLTEGADHTITALLPELRWTRTFSNSYNMLPPAVGSNGTIYVLNQGTLSAFSPAGEAVWELPLGGYTSYGGPMVGDDGTIYVPVDTSIFAVTSGGQIAWQVAISHMYAEVVGMALGADGTIYAATTSALIAFSAQGTRKWSATLPGHRAISPPTIGPDGTIYVLTDTALTALSPDGQTKWRYSEGNGLGSYEQTALALDNDGTVYFGTWQGAHAVKPDGTLKWHIKTDNYMGAGSPSINQDGAICVQLMDSIVGVNPDGKVLWRTQNGGYYSYGASMAISADNMMQAGSSYNSGIQSIGAGGMPRWQYATEEYVSYQTASAITQDGMMYVNYGYSLYAFKLPAGPASSAWPMFQHDARRTGRVGAR